MAYLSAENAKTYRALLSIGGFGADTDEPGEPIPPSTGPGGSYGFPNAPGPGPQAPTGPNSGPIRTNPVITPPIPVKQPGSAFVPRALPGFPPRAPNTVMIGTDTFTPTTFTSPGAFQPANQPAEENIKTNYMPFVYIGGAGLLLYYLFKKK